MSLFRGVKTLLTHPVHILYDFPNKFFLLSKLCRPPCYAALCTDYVKLNSKIIFRMWQPRRYARAVNSKFVFSKNINMFKVVNPRLK